MTRDYKGVWPKIDKDAFEAETAAVIGDVEIGKDCSIWDGAVLRGDESPIRIGEKTNVQDNCVLHCDDYSPMVIGENVTIGHGAIVHGATIGDNVLIGMGAIILNGAKIGDNAVIGAGAVVKENADIPAGSLAVGVPAKVVRTLTEEQIKERKTLSYYVELSKNYIRRTSPIQ